MRSKHFMNDEQHLREKKRPRLFRYWLILSAFLFLVLVTLTQFLPGGTRTFSDWLPALFFLLTVSLATTGFFMGVCLVVRPPFTRRKSKRLLFALACIVILVVLKEVWVTWHALDS